ncbi:MAG: radical SAM protein [Nanoarchaeota archaeon]|nr:radical SAM protein [Nanoarchaeota archaeon]
MDRDLIDNANSLFLENHSEECFFERAIFLSWYCSKGDCRFCWMSTQKNLIRDPKKAKRRPETILAEVLISKLLDWKIEFLSGGYESYTQDELISLIKNINLIYPEKCWLNMGTLNKEELIAYRPYIKGVTGAVETINPVLHTHLCPSKPLSDIEMMFDICKEMDIDRSITIIIGLGETFDDFFLLKKFIEKYEIQRITFYALNPHKNTIFTKGPDSEYYAEWIAKTRISFPKLEIVAGSWTERLSEINLLLRAGANSITKFKSIKLFGSSYAKTVADQVSLAKREFKSNLTRLPEKDITKYLYPFPDELKIKIIEKYNMYYNNRLKKNGK